ncbi:MAG: DUF4123 domain-containing protein [Candidatus Accumulibacter sp.]|uniref:DUF4123 domain-containing protein n=1 Tax=Candidatus Accumulibacter proximus TaxID=2954385 RepID=A0A935PX12_9PROT|nr:DUF4123 domain-containing protein [Candidatus Accumulibacter proximus]
MSNVDSRSRYDASSEGSLLTHRQVSTDSLARQIAAGQVYAVIDPCGCDAILKKVIELPRAQCICLFDHDKFAADFEDYWAVAPYLVNVNAGILSWIIDTIWQEPWGVLLLTESRRDSLLGHLRNILLVKGPDDEPLYFRFYDPRVLEDFLATCHARELAELFGRTSGFGIKTGVRGVFNVASPKNGSGAYRR